MCFAAQALHLLESKSFEYLTNGFFIRFARKFIRAIVSIKGPSRRLAKTLARVLRLFGRRAGISCEELKEIHWIIFLNFLAKTFVVFVHQFNFIYLSTLLRSFCPPSSQSSLFSAVITSKRSAPWKPRAAVRLAVYLRLGVVLSCALRLKHSCHWRQVDILITQFTIELWWNEIYNLLLLGFFFQACEVRSSGLQVEDASGRIFFLCCLITSSFQETLN